MKLYKFRSFANLEHLLDIVLNERLYCARFDELNDPFEGVYLSTHHVPNWLIGGGGKSIIRTKSAAGLRDVEDSSRICSLSASFSDLRLWAYYADGHKGVAVEIDFQGHEQDISPVDYLTALPKYADWTVLGTPFADQVLTKKTAHWQHEAEFRILQAETYYAIPGRITSVLVGSRISPDRRALLSTVLANRIPLRDTFINEHTLAVEIGRSEPVL